MAQERLLKLLHLMELLLYNDRFKRNTGQLAERLEVSCRTVQRMIATLELSGFVIDRLGRGIYSLRSDEGPLKNLSQVMYFTEEEAVILARLIASLRGDLPLKNNLYEKIQRYFSFPRRADLLIAPEFGKNLSTLQQAVDQRKCVILHDYRSSSSNLVSDRHVEPFQFTINFHSVMCFDRKDSICKTFALARIGWVEVLGENWKFEDHHKPIITDVFRNSSDTPVGKVVLKLNTRAYNLLIEEYPLAEKHITGTPPEVIFAAEVSRYEGPARFVMGLAEDIEVMGDDGFIEFLKGRLGKIYKKFFVESEND
ncbi:MAG: hypothetical protein PWP07_1820 [Epulopiscium sp.]|jgi:predicted DNA-binding transcriptional regulator YafY|nr:hypothetical protein [Eubacteriaceae bacterium]MDK2788575.1 hypothetical protein [Candidatus Epulonipiscium sp.]